MNTLAHGPGDPLTAMLLQITQHAERLAALDEREASHYQEIAGRVAKVDCQLTDTSKHVEEVAATTARQSAVLDSIKGLDQQVAALAAQLTDLATHGPGRGDGLDTDSYRPAPTPRWWKLQGEERERALARLRAWVEQVYRPSYGHLSAALGPCWEQHPLCLYGLDWLMELWSVLYLTDGRNAPALASQAEWQTRLLPALAEQMYLETTRCGHRQLTPTQRDTSHTAGHGHEEHPTNATEVP